MEIVKKRKKPKRLRQLEVLDKRMSLAYPDRKYLLNLEKGYEGEKAFDLLIEKYAHSEAVIVNDLLLTYKGTTAQLDTLMIMEETIYLYEIKNYEGDFFYLPGQLRTSSGQAINCPSIQLGRTKMLLEKILNQWNVQTDINTFVVFVNPAFTLYEAKISEPFILPTQIEKHFTDLNKQKKPLSKNCRYLADKLIVEHKSDGYFQIELPDYTLENIRKGTTCKGCGTFNIQMTQRVAHCSFCQKSWSLEETLLYTMEEYRLLFPEERITTSCMHEWCGAAVPKRRIRKLIKEHYETDLINYH